MIHDLGDPIIYDQPVPKYQATTPGFEHCSRHFVGPFFGGTMCVSGQYPQYPHAWIPNWVKIEGPFCSANVVLKNVRGPRPYQE